MLRLKAEVTRAALSAVSEDVASLRARQVATCDVGSDAPALFFGQQKRELDQSPFAFESEQAAKRQQVMIADQESAPASRSWSQDIQRNPLMNRTPPLGASPQRALAHATQYRASAHDALLQDRELIPGERPARDDQAASLRLGLSPVTSPKGPVSISTAMPEALSLGFAANGPYEQPTAHRPLKPSDLGIPSLPFPSPHLSGIPMVRSGTSGLSVDGCLSLLDIPDSAFSARASPLTFLAP